MKYDLYNDDLRENPRQTESSVVVLPVWTREQDAYVPVFPVKGSPPEVARQFASITAERIFFRRKILGYYDAENDFVGNRIIREARPFGENGPTLAILLDVGTTAAMTYVPLASAQSGGESVLARLYCVSGLEGSYPLPFNCEDSRKWFGYNWPQKSSHLPSGNVMHLLISDNGLRPNMCLRVRSAEILRSWLSTRSPRRPHWGECPNT